jgi:chitinase
MRPSVVRSVLLAGILGALGIRAQAGVWNSAYYAGWMQSYLPAQGVDFTAMTHVIHFAVVPKADGSLDSDVNVVTLANSTDVVTRAHAAGVKVLISLGGEGSASGFQGATSAANRARFVTNIVNFVISRKYDGVDLDWEPLNASDAGLFTNLVTDLRAALNVITPRPLLTAAVASQPALFASLQSKFDQINLMTYSLSGPYPGWVTWFNSPIYDGGYKFASTGQLVPSMDGMVSNFLANGVAASKLGIGISFYGYVWSGGAGTSTGGAALPRQSWTTAPTATEVTYSAIMSNYYQAQLYFWDTNAQSAYLSIDQSGSANDKFISYDDETACRAKVAYADRRGLGGFIIWELGGGYRADLPAGQRDLLLQSVKESRAKLFRITGLGLNGTDAVVTFSTVAGLDYTIERTDTLAVPSWSPVTSVTANTPNTQATNDSAIAQSARFYRVREIHNGTSP